MAASKEDYTSKKGQTKKPGKGKKKSNMILNLFFSLTTWVDFPLNLNLKSTSNVSSQK